MSFNFFDQGYVPSDSYSRELDRRVARDEFPYGYDGGEPPQGHHNIGYSDEKYRNEKLKPQKEHWPREKVSVKRWAGN